MFTEMNYVFYNPNPSRKLVGDCVIRALSKALKQSWEDTYLDVMRKGFEMHDMPSSNNVWSAYLKAKGYRRYSIPDTCPDCYTIKDFCIDNPFGAYILGTGSHVVAVENGTYFDSWDSGDEVPIFYWKRG